MSTIGVTYHDEDIHNILRKKDIPLVKSPRYKSKHIPFVPGKGRGTHDTFGLPHYDLNPPSQFLRKNSRRVILPRVECEERRCTLPDRKVNVPGHVCAKKKEKDVKCYPTENIKWADGLEPGQHPIIMVDRYTGDRNDMAAYVESYQRRDKETYGRIPKYLCSRVKAWEREREKMKKHREATQDYRNRMGIGQMGMGENVVMLAKEERQKLLDGLKANWADLQLEYQLLPVICDTTGKIRRKLNLENSLKLIEKDINIVERHPYIYLERGSYDKIAAKVAADATLLSRTSGSKTGDGSGNGNTEDTTKEGC